METPSGHPSSLTQISTNSKQPNTLHSELSQAAPQTQTSNIYTQKQKYSHSEPTSNHMLQNSGKSSTSYTSSSSTYKANPKSQTNETNHLRKHFFHHKPLHQPNQ